MSAFFSFNHHHKWLPYQILNRNSNRPTYNGDMAEKAKRPAMSDVGSELVCDIYVINRAKLSF